MKKLWDWLTVARHGIWIGIIIIGCIALNIWWGSFFWAFTGALLQLAIVEAVALGFSNVAIYVYTRITFAQDFATNAVNDKLANAVVLAAIYMGTHLLVGTCIGLFYWSQFN